jgi:hypothetical protein
MPMKHDRPVFVFVLLDATGQPLPAFLLPTKNTPTCCAAISPGRR